MTEFASQEWRAAGACASVDPDLFFPIAPGGKAVAQIALARMICAGCQVRRQCLEFAMDMRVMEGVWGGTTPEERTRVRRQEAARRRRERPQAPAATVA